MTEPKPLASLSANLLARKGAARPAMRRAYIPAGNGPALSSSLQYDGHDDLGWNDMGADDGHPDVPPLTMVGLTSAHPAPAAATPAPATDVPPVVEQRQELEAKLAAPAAKPITPAALAHARKAKAAFTLRLDPARHLRLRLACAVNNRSAQQIVTQALDAFLDSQPDLEKLARQVPDDGTSNAD